MQGKKWIGTLHLSNDVNEASTKMDVFARSLMAAGGLFVCLGLEAAPTPAAGSKGHHAQIAAVFKTNKRLKALKDLDATVHWEQMRGPLDKAIAYCKKAETGVELKPGDGKHVITYGEEPKNEQGKRTDIQCAVDALKEAIRSGLTQREALVTLTEAHASTLVKYGRGFDGLAEMLASLELPAMAAPAWRKWQERLLKRLEDPLENRRIIWVYDPKGNAGKSTLTRWLLSNTLGPSKYKSCYLSGKMADMYYTYSKYLSQIVIFDVPRTSEDHRTHLAMMAETLKNGFYNNTKYQSSLVRFAPPHVVFFSNSPPDPSWWSADRLELITINRVHIAMPGEAATAAGAAVLDYDSETDKAAGVHVQKFTATTEPLEKIPPGYVERKMREQTAYLQQQCAFAGLSRQCADFVANDGFVPGERNYPGRVACGGAACGAGGCICHLRAPPTLKRKRSSSFDEDESDDDE